MNNNSQAKKRAEIKKLKREIGRRISVIRKTSDSKKQKTFTERMGISQSQVSAIECGRSTLSINVVNQLMRLRINGARINMDWLFTGEGPMLIYKPLDDQTINEVILSRLSQLDKNKKEVIIRVMDNFT